MSKNPRTVKVQTPWQLIVLSIGAGLLVMGGIVYATWYSMRQIDDAKMTGLVVQKIFTPAPEQQITLGRDGISAQQKKGEYVIVVSVKGRDGQTREYNVWLDEERYEALKVGDAFDVGPYLVPDTAP